MSEFAARAGFTPLDLRLDELKLVREAVKPRVGSRLFLRLLAIGTLAIAAGISWSDFHPAPTPARTVEPAVQEDWSVANLPPLFDFDSSGLGAADIRYEATAERISGARRDSFAAGSLDGRDLALRFEALRNAQPAARKLFVELAVAAAADGHSLTKFGEVQRLATARGVLEWAELTLLGTSSARQCLGFRLVSAGAANFQGFICAADDEPLDAGALSCVMERLNVTRAGRDMGFADLVKGPAPRRPACRIGG
jgi:hypothetical protein